MLTPGVDEALDQLLMIEPWYHQRTRERTPFVLEQPEWRVSRLDNTTRALRCSTKSYRCTKAGSDDQVMVHHNYATAWSDIGFDRRAEVHCAIAFSLMQKHFPPAIHGL